MAECTPDECRNPGPRGGNCGDCYRQKWRQRNLAKVREQDRIKAARLRAADPSEHLAVKRRQYERNPDLYKARVAARRAANLEAERERERLKSVRYRAENLEKMRELVRDASKRWRAENPLRVREYGRARRALMAGGKVDYAAILLEHGMTCHLCGDAIAGASVLHFDHVIPLARGGAHNAENIRPSHALCNLRKGARIIPC